MEQPAEAPAVEPAADTVKAEEAAAPPGAAAVGAAGVVLGPRQRKRVTNAEYVQLYDEELYASDDSLSDGEPYRRNKRRAGGGSTPAQRAKRSKRETLEQAHEADVARGVGFDPYTLSDEEQAFMDEQPYLPPRIDEPAYCEIRNHVLAKWRADVTRVLTEENARAEIKSVHLKLVAAAYNFLHRYGFINFGMVAKPPLAGPSDAYGTVVILGAGLSGLVAARQLMAFGHKVAVVEARQRPGGRVHTLKLEPDDPLSAPPGCCGMGELGGSVITGTDGNPLAVVARQLGAQLHNIRNLCPIYALDGAPIDEVLDKRIEKQFNDLLDACGAFRTAIGASADIVSLGRAMEQLSSEHGVGTASVAERAVLDWHMANLEYANAAPLKTLSLGQWDQDDPWEMTGEHCVLPGGNLRIVTALAQGVPIFYGCHVKRVEHGAKGVALHCVETTPGAESAASRERVFRADAALITLPLGVLKKETVAFDPPLPKNKRAAIQALGFGTLNKCVMLFAEPFWETTLDTFGRVGVSTVARGEFFLFYSYIGVSGTNGAVLIGLVAGEAASAFEAEPGEAGLKRCLDVLRSIYGRRGITVPAPVTWRCTRWEGDPLSFGSYSHVAVGASGADYDAMAEPVANRLFFGGEATTRKHPATMHGAFFTGLREAAKITGSVVGRRRRAAANGAGGGLHHDGSTPASALDAARDLAHLHTQLAAAFATPAWEFGVFALALHPTKTEPDTVALVRVDVGGGGGSSVKRSMHIYMSLRLADALGLRDCPGGDSERLRLLLSLTGGALFGRRALSPEARTLAAELAAQKGVPLATPPPSDDPGSADAPIVL